MSAPANTAPAPASGGDPRAVQTSQIKAILTHSATLVFAVNLLLIAFFVALSPNHVFWSLDNADALLRNGTEILFLALGVTLLMSAGVFDLSIGANLVLASVIGALTMRALGDWGLPSFAGIIVGLVVCLAAGAAFGAVNGLIITKLRVNSLIATLGTLGVGSGVAQLLTEGQDVRQLPEELQSDFALAKLGFVPMPMLVALIALGGVWALLRYTRFGMRTLAIGSNTTAAARAGIAVHAHII